MPVAKRSIAVVKKTDAPPRRRASPVPPKFIEPQLCLLAKQAPSGPDWVHELKLDGFRMAARINAGKVQLLTRTGLDWSEKYPATVAALKKLKVESAYLDGELCGIGPDGMPDFGLTQQATDGAKAIRLMYYVFDLLYLNGEPLAFLPLGDRKARLRPLLKGIAGCRYNAHEAGDGEAIRLRQCDLGAEGIVSKKIDAPYTPGNRGIWIKSKCLNRQEFIIVGWTDPEGARSALGALLLGYYDDAGGLVYAGRVGTGFSDKLLVDLLKKLQPLEIDHMPLAAPPPKRGRGKPLRPATTHWVKPKLVAEISYMTWASDGLLRHSVFVGLRADKPARQVRREG
ncbi:non-homologous end-joining DNA ligase [Roseiarcaceae bacterium H3SJ34-1]|uniref:non-homologous end-joining DNA ligase n=1 Tax=Terripilifer ovatus TaxID=3032367 RepID=UPI003AB99B31|nr:non-homologous end-joining DNA ligase [Roseiarcaceae bacterium H3SJ34-1]